MYGCFNEMKWAYFVSRSTATIIAKYPMERGNPSTKSIAMSDQTRSERERGWSEPGVSCYLLYNVGTHHTTVEIPSSNGAPLAKRMCVVTGQCLMEPKVTPCWCGLTFCENARNKCGRGVQKDSTLLEPYTITQLAC